MSYSGRPPKPPGERGDGAAVVARECPSPMKYDA